MTRRGIMLAYLISMSIILGLGVLITPVLLTHLLRSIRMRETILIPAAIIVATLLSLAAFADNKPTFHANGKEITKVEALRILINDPNQTVQKCQPQEVSDKATLRNKKINQ